MPWSARPTRRGFLRAGSAAAALAAVGRWSLPVARAGGRPRPLPEYAGDLSRALVVYDQVAAPHLLREIAAILWELPAGCELHVLCGRGRVDEARERLSAWHPGEPHFHELDQASLRGDWGRDILQLRADADGKTRILAPLDKGARERGGLDRLLGHFAPLAAHGLPTTQLPVAGEGGNLMGDLRGDRGLVLAGSTIAVETRGLYRQWYGFDPGDAGVATILREHFGADELVWLGPSAGGQLAPQCLPLFHIDMGMTLLGEGHAMVLRCHAGALGEGEHRELLADEAQATLDMFAEQAALGIGSAAPCPVPADAGARRAWVAERLAEEREALGRASAELDLMAQQLAAAGYRVDRLDSDPRRVRKFQSHTNAIVGRDRVLVPVFPTDERVHAATLSNPEGRSLVQFRLGTLDSSYGLEGDNLRALEFYAQGGKAVRPIRDYFYLAAGNLHCVLGRLDGDPTG